MIGLGVVVVWASACVAPQQTIVAAGAQTPCSASNSAPSTTTLKFSTCTRTIGALASSGLTIPDTSYLAGGCNVTASSNCARTIFMATGGNDSSPGTKAAPVRTINRAVSLVPAGGTVVMRGGEYRDWYNNGHGNYAIVGKSFTLQAYPHEQPWFDGADVEAANKWTSDGAGHWSMPWSTPEFCDGGYYRHPYNQQPTSNSGPCAHSTMYGDPNYAAAADPQMVFIDGQNRHEVTSLSAATGGNFFYNWSQRRIYISTNPAGHDVQVSARPVALVMGAYTGNYAIKGIGFRRYATNEYDNLTNAAVYAGGGGNDTFENDVFTQQAATGLKLSATAGTVIRSTVFAYNGFDGVNAHGHAGRALDNFRIGSSVFNYNNVEHFGTHCKSACAMSNIKMSMMAGYTLTNNIFENAQGIANGAWCDTGCSRGVFTRNYVANNGGYGYLYEVDDTGIVAGNLFLNNRYGIAMLATNTKICNNTLIDSTDYSIKLYDDKRAQTTHNLAVCNNVTYGTSSDTNYFASIGGSAGPDSFMSELDYNSYYRPQSSMLYRLTDGSGQQYTTVAALRAAGHPSWESHAQDIVGGADPFFVNFGAGNYAIRSNSVAYRNGGPIPADVAAALGVSTAAGQHRGAFSWASQ